MYQDARKVLFHPRIGQEFGGQGSASRSIVGQHGEAARLVEHAHRARALGEEDVGPRLIRRSLLLDQQGEVGRGEARRSIPAAVTSRSTVSAPSR